MEDLVQVNIKCEPIDHENEFQNPWDLVKFSNIFQLLHRVTKLMECMPHNPTKTMGDSRFHQKFQPADAHRLPHGGFAHRAETPRYGRSGT